MKSMFIRCIFLLGGIITMGSLASEQAFCQMSVISDNSQGKRRETLRNIEVVVRETNSTKDDFLKSKSKLKKAQRKIMGWAYSTPDEIAKDHQEFSQSVNNARLQAEELKFSAQRLRDYLTDIGVQESSRIRQDQYIQMKASAERMAEISKSSSRVLKNGNKLMKNIDATLEKTNIAYRKHKEQIQALNSKAAKVQSQHIGKMEKYVTLLAIYAEIEEHQLGLLRDIEKMAAYTIARSVGTKAEAERAFNGLGQADRSARELLAANYDTDEMVNQLLDMIATVSNVGGLSITPDLEKKIDHGIDILENGEDPRRSSM